MPSPSLFVLLLASTLDLALGMAALVVLALLAFGLAQTGARREQPISKEQNA